MRRAVHLFLIAAAAGLAVSLSGCVIIADQSSQQVNTIGAVKLTTSVCFSGQDGCPAKGNSDTQGPGGFQVLLGYRLPAASSPPQTISSSGGQPLSFTRDTSYSAELQRLAPAGIDQKWVGYRSGQIPSLSSPGFTVSPSFGLRQDSQGAPFAGPFAYRVVAGARATPESNVNAPVDCGSDLRGSNTSKTTCVDSPSIAEIGSNLEQLTQDLGIMNDRAARRASRGRSKTVAFRVVYASRGGPVPTFNLSASTDLPGGDVSLRPGSLSPNPGPTKVRVHLHIPPDTPRGSYDVTLVASLNGQTRSRTQRVRIGHGGTRCGSIRPTITGTSGKDRLVGTRGRDVISGFGGADVILGRAGNDLICAGAGDDLVKGGAGNDTIAGRRGKDLLVGGRGRDLMIGGPGRDRFKH